LPIDINTAAFAKLHSIAERNNEISVLIIDYRMPGITGIELCRRLKHIPAKKILLTGEADNAQAIAAFNEGIIDCYIRKNSETLTHDVLVHINKLTHEYFCDFSRSLLSHLEIDRKIPLSDPVFNSFFKEWCQKNDICEHYVLDKQGNMQVINNEGKSSYFIVHTNNTLAEFVALYEDNKDLVFYLDLIRKKDKIPFFGVGQEAWQYSPVNWKSNLYNSQILEGRESYYWAIKEA
jgi:response regulator RpfG family c-di-GMP phosphodiesterase